MQIAECGPGQNDAKNHYRHSPPEHDSPAVAQVIRSGQHLRNFGNNRCWQKRLDLLVAVHSIVQELHQADDEHSEEDASVPIIPAKLTKAQVRRLQEYAVRAFRCLELRGMARVDFFLERKTKRILLNEVNTIPGFTPLSMYPRLWQASGVPYPDLIARLVELALERHDARTSLLRERAPVTGD